MVNFRFYDIDDVASLPFWLLAHIHVTHKDQAFIEISRSGYGFHLVVVDLGRECEICQSYADQKHERIKKYGKEIVWSNFEWMKIKEFGVYDE